VIAGGGQCPANRGEEDGAHGHQRADERGVLKHRDDRGHHEDHGDHAEGDHQDRQQRETGPGGEHRPAGRPAAQ